MNGSCENLPAIPRIDDRADAIDHAARLSRFVRDRLNARPEWREELEKTLDDPWTEDRMVAALEGETDLMRALRTVRNRVVLSVAVRDLSGRASLDEVVATVSALADVSIRHAVNRITFDLGSVYGRAVAESSGRPIGLVVVAMGKLGGLELNVSSDIDLVFLYAEEGRTEGPRAIGNHEYFDIAGRRVIAALNEATADGFAFRVDMRLRPWGESGPLAMNLSMLEDYLVTQGRPWERYAWIKARVVCGAPESDVTALVDPFVYRRYLDYSAIASLRELRQQIRAEEGRRDRRDDVKLGPGGIREVEFIAQVFQLIRGGRDNALRSRSTRRTLECLRESKLLPESAVDELQAAYRFLRQVEHRLQYLDDAQTQTLPRSADDLAAIATGMGFPDAAAFRAGLGVCRGLVERQFDAVFAEGVSLAPNALSELWWGTLGDEDGAARLTGMGYRDAREAVRRLSVLRSSSRYRALPDASRARFDALVPIAIESAARTSSPDQSLDRVCDLLQAVARRSSYLALLLEYPRTMEQIAALASRSRWAMQYLTQHPMLLDEMLDRDALHTPQDWEAWGRELAASLAQAGGDIEAEMDALRHFKQTVVFRLVVQDLADLVKLETLSDHLSALADLLLEKVVSLAWRELPRRHRDDAPRFAIVGFGKLGGKELGYGSDLDMIFIYDDTPESAEVYARLAQRVNQWLSAYTSAGVLYETDLRLRPDGASGLLVSSLDAFERYQREKAWVWEHQALTRARFCAGYRPLAEGFERVREAVLRTRREAAVLRGEIVAMRSRMDAEHRSPAGQFEVKHGRGGIVDVEFIVQYLVLAHSADCPELTRNAGNIALLGIAADHGYIAADLARAAADSYRELRRRQHLAWLHEDTQAVIDADEAKPLTEPVVALWRRLMEAER